MSHFINYALWRFKRSESPDYWYRRPYSLLKATVTDTWYYLRCAVWHRYHVISLHRTMGPTYSDPRELMLHAAFELLRSAVEDEGLYEGWNLDDIDSEVAKEVNDVHGGDLLRRQLDGYVKLRALYHWWTVERPARERDSASWSRDTEEEDQQKFMELAAMREWLWT
jgi:hypothetical protein